MSQSCFSLGFLFQNFLWKLLTIRGYNGYLYWCVFGMRKVRFFPNRVVWRLGLATWLSCDSESQANYLARLEVFSCSALASVTVQLPYMLHTCASFCGLPAASHSRDPVVSTYRMHTSELFFTLSHTLPLYNSHLNLARNKANKMVD